MKLRNVSKREIRVKFLRLDGAIDPDRRDTGDPVEIVIASMQMADIPDIQWDKLRERKPYKQHLSKGNLIEEGNDGTIIPGDGDVDCPLCLGRGFVSKDGRAGVRCQCVYKRDVMANVRKIWPGYDLMRAPVLKVGRDGRPGRSPLLKLVEEDAWITADKSNFRSHLRNVAVRQGPAWFARVRSDTDMMTGWLASAKAKSIEIYDADVAEAVARDMDIHDLAEPPDLLIMVLGVKRARNAATPEVLMEILAIREHVDKPTWVVDQPTYSICHETHRSNSEEVMGALETFRRVELDKTMTFVEEADQVPNGVEDVTFDPRPIPTRARKPPSLTLSNLTGAARGRSVADSVPHNIGKDDE